MSRCCPKIAAYTYPLKYARELIEHNLAWFAAADDERDPIQDDCDFRETWEDTDSLRRALAARPWAFGNAFHTPIGPCHPSRELQFEMRPPESDGEHDPYPRAVFPLEAEAVAWDTARSTLSALLESLDEADPVLSALLFADDSLDNEKAVSRWTRAIAQQCFTGESAEQKLFGLEYWEAVRTHISPWKRLQTDRLAQLWAKQPGVYRAPSGTRWPVGAVP